MVKIPFKNGISRERERTLRCGIHNGQKLLCGSYEKPNTEQVYS
jgi:hypothetical protein